jgi:hypothetical protein
LSGSDSGLQALLFPRALDAFGLGHGMPPEYL